MLMHELVSDEEMAAWPLRPMDVAQVIRLVMKSGSVELFKKIKLLKVRPRVLLGLGRMYLEQGHGECAKTAAAVLHANVAAMLHVRVAAALQVKLSAKQHVPGCSNATSKCCSSAAKWFE